MKSFEFNTFEEAYPQLIKALLEEGEEVSPRGMLTREISPVGITIKDPTKHAITHPVRKLNYGFMVGELLWLLQSQNSVENIAHYNSQWLNFTDDGITLNGAYGKRIFNYQSCVLEGNQNGLPIYTSKIVNQFEEAYQQLLKDPDSRQATIVLFNPALDYTDTKDKPCTNLMRFTIRKGKLNMMVVMRSNDIQKGFPYDVYNFTMLQEIMAGRLGVDVGKYTHIADSLHIYESDFEIAQQIINSPHYNLNNDVCDARLSEDIWKIELERVFNVEIATRKTSEVIKLEIIEKMLNDIQNDYWRSSAAVIAIYNLRKARRSQEDIDKLKPFVVNEFKEIIKGWKTLKRD